MDFPPLLSLSDESFILKQGTSAVVSVKMTAGCIYAVWGNTLASSVGRCGLSV